jgi:superfamily II DNA or RNA helicase
LRVINDWLSQRPSVPAKKHPRPDQIEALAKINDELARADRAQSIQFCGTGKSLVSLWLMESRAPDTTLVFVPTLALLSQIHSDWILERKSKFLYLCVCSDPSVVDNEGDTFSPDDCAFPVSTSSDAVRQFLALPSTFPKVVFCTYQSTHVISGAGRHVWDLGIFDEAHKTAGRAGRSFSAALNDDKVPIRKRVFFTATPRHCNPLRKDAQGEAEVLYFMDDETLYGKVAYELSCRKAVELGIISDYKVIVTVFTTAEINDWLLKQGKVLITSANEGADFVTAWDVANQLALVKAYTEFGVQKAFSFHSRVRQAKDFVSDGVQGISSHLEGVEWRSVDGSMNIGERRAIMELIKDSPRALLANARCLTEGVNLPSVDCVAFLSPKRSRIDVAQAMGRGMRKNGREKKTGYVVVPLYVAALGEGENYEEAIKRAKFDTVLEVLQTLKEVDESFADYLKELAQPKKRAKGSSDWKLSEHLKFIAPEVLLEQLVETISLECIDSLIPSWEKMFAELVAFKEAHGHCNVLVESGPLGQWVHTQRQRCKIPERRARLNAIGFCWNPFTAAWDKKIEELVAYKKVHGHCNVPAQSGLLGQWCSMLRTKRRRNELSTEQIAQLDAIGFCWGPHADIWDKRAAELIAYQKIHGHCNVPHSYGPLGVWVSTVRRRWRKGKLSPERIAQLNALGFCWDYDVDLWDTRIAELVAFKKVHGHCNVPKVKGDPLGIWCDTIRQIRKEGKLSPERIAQLDAIGFCWMPHAAKWDKRIEELIAFKKVHGHCNVPITRGILGSWVSTVRASRRKGTLSQERIDQLNALDFCWNPRTEQSRKLKTAYEAAA